MKTITNSFPPVALDPKNKDLSLRYSLNEEALRTKLAGYPDDLILLCIDLLAGDSKMRPLGNEVIKRLGAEDSQSLSFAADPCCLGREDELEQMTQCFKTQRMQENC